MAIFAELADGRRLEFPDGTDPAIVQSTVKKVLAGSSRQSPAPAERTGPLQVAGDVGAGLLRGASSIGATILAPFQAAIAGTGQTGARDRRTKFLSDVDEGAKYFGADPESMGYAVGKFGGELAGTAGVGGGLAQGARAVGVAPSVVRALETYGLQTGLAPKGAAGVLSNTALKAGAGALAGGATLAMIDPESMGTGAAIGAAVPTVAAPIVRAAGRAVGSGIDVLTGRTGVIKAGAVLRQVAGEDLPAYRAALSAAAPGQTAAQAGAGLKNDMLDALGKFAEVGDRSSYYSRQAAGERQALIDSVRQIAGGANQTEARQAANAAQGRLNQVTTPMREEALNVANVNTETARRLEAEAGRLSGVAANKVEDVRRLDTAGNLAEAAALRGPRLARLGGAPPPQGRSPRVETNAPEPLSSPVPGLVRTPPRYSYGRELSDLAERLGSKAADDSLILGEAGRFKQMQLESMAQDGVKPLTSGGLVRSLTEKINDPRIGSEALKEKALSYVRDRVSQWTGAGGVIDAHALYGIRKSAVNDTIEQLLGASDPKAKSKAAAGLLKEVKPLIDDAIESAGGVGWKNYLKTFEEGAAEVSKKKLGAVALQLLEKSPRKFEDLVAGNSPKTVEKIFGTEYDIATAMGSKFGPMREAADILATNRSVNEGASRGGAALRAVLSEHVPKFKLFNVLDPRVAIMNRILGEGEVRIGTDMQKRLIEGMKTGKSAEELLNTLPTSARARVAAAMAGGGAMRSMGAARPSEE